MSSILDPSCHRRPDGLRACLSTLALAAGAICLSAAPAAVRSQTINVSALVNGSTSLLPAVAAGATPVPCGSACQYARASNVGMVTGYDETPGPYTTAAWPPLYTSSLAPYGSVLDDENTPAPPSGVTQDDSGMGVLRRAQVSFPTQLQFNTVRQLSVQTWKGGSGAATTTVTIRVTPTTTKGYFLQFKVPQLKRSWKEAWYVGGPSQNQPFYDLPKQMQARSMVDVVADGMPVWSATSLNLKPRRWSPPYLQYFDLQWGPSLDDADQTVTLYLGALPAGQTRSFSLIFRTDLRVSSDSCQTDTEYGVSYQRCDNRREAMTLPGTSVTSGGVYQFVSYVPDVRVYTY